MEYSKCQQGDDDDDYDEENCGQQRGGTLEQEEAFEDEPSAASAAEPSRRRPGRRQQHVDEDYTDEKGGSQVVKSSNMAPLEMEESNGHENGDSHPLNANDDYYDDEEEDDDDEHHRHDDGDDNDAVSLLGSETGGSSSVARATGDFYIRNSHSNASTDGSTNSYHTNNNNGRRSSGGGGGTRGRGGVNHYRYNNRGNDITLREMAAVQGKTCGPVYLCAVILLALLVAAVFVAPKPATTAPTSSAATTDSGSGSDSHYRSPASAAQQQQLQCELDITGVSSSSSSSSWDAYVQNVSSDGDHRCLDDTLVPKKHATTTIACRCKNPTVPDFPHEPVSYQQGWQRTFQRNVDRIAQWQTSSLSSSAGEAPSKTNNLDVVLLGDSITEHWVGSDLSNERPQRLSGNVQVFQSLFGNATATPSATKSSTTNLLGLALGISGDRCPNLLYRLQNGELPAALQPSIFWILIGTNDVGTDQCRASQVIAGNIAIVKYIQQERPNAKIVLNSILPRGRPDSLQVLDHWREVYQPINQALDCFVQGYQKQQQLQNGDNSNHDDDKDHGQLYFFNATDLFLTSDSQSINYTLLPDGLHPGEEGSWVWGRAMVEKIQDLLSS